MQPQLFLSGLKNFPVHTWCLQIKLPVHTHPMVPKGSSAIKCLQSMCHKVGCSGGKFALLLLLCRHISSLFDKRPDTILLCHWIKKYPDSRLFYSGEWNYKYLDSVLNSPNACGGKLYLERKGCGLKKFRIMCRQGLSERETTHSLVVRDSL